MIRDPRLPDPDTSFERMFDRKFPAPPHRSRTTLKVTRQGLEYTIETNRTETRWWLTAIRPGSWSMSEHSSTTSRKIADGWAEAILEAEE